MKNQNKNIIQSPFFILKKKALYMTSTLSSPASQKSSSKKSDTNVEDILNGGEQQGKQPEQMKDFSIMETVSNEYNADAITVLEGLEPVRKRPGMYIGSTGQKGLHHLVFEVVDNSVDESLAGYCKKISLTLNNDGSVEVQDDGRGIPCSIHPKTGKSALETVLCVLHAGGKFGGDDSGYKVSGGLHGVGISVVNALSESLLVEVARDGYVNTMQFSKGIPLTPLITKPLLENNDENNDNSASMTNIKRGTKVIFKPDPLIFKTTIDFDFEKLAGRVDELAYLNAGLTIEMIDKRDSGLRRKGKAIIINDDGDEVVDRRGSSSSSNSKSKNGGKGGDSSKDNSDETNNTIQNDNKKYIINEAEQQQNESLEPRVEVFRHDGGIKELVEVLCADKASVHADVGVIYIKQEKKGVAVEVALQWSNDMYTDNLTGFANGIRTSGRRD